MDEERLIYEVEKRRILYDPQHPFYKDLIKKDDVWLEIAELLGVSSVEDVKSKWKSIRNTFVRYSRKAPSGSGGAKEHKHRRILCFLLPYVQPRSSRGNLNEPQQSMNHPPQSPDTEIESDTEPENGGELPMEPQPASSHVLTELQPVSRQISTGRQTSAANVTSSDNFNFRRSRRGPTPAIAPETSELLAILRSSMPKEDEDESFAMSLVPELRKVVTNKGQLKLQLLALIVNWEGQQIAFSATSTAQRYVPGNHHQPTYPLHQPTPTNSWPRSSPK